tara:strand:- start:156 stop:434 length:279 start_codon:yes stop_codon:yes gene_type:complete
MGKNVTIITVPGCPWCKKAINLAESSGYDLEVKKMSWGTELREIQANEGGWKTVPMVYVGDGELRTFIGGYTEFAEFVRENAGQQETEESKR